MARPLNLLRWRERRRRECVRFWGLLFVGAWLIALMLIFAGRAGQMHQQKEQALRQQNDRALLQAFIQREQQLHAELERRENVETHRRERALTRRWQSTLQRLAEYLPEQAWLTAVTWQGNAFSFTGLANRFPALSQVDTAVRSLPGFRAVSPGAMLRDAQGHWQFSYQLQAEGGDGKSR
ncbi:PilN domain-containing protein [Scandinavium sp. M-37]|uniref:PilN domain-containing protein n=1 Tax=Scandinavium sp. M-37 TaxID=3373077 RepID=UPI003745C058